MAKRDQMTVTRVNKYIEMVEKELEPLSMIIEAARERLRIKIENEMRKSLGLNKLDARIDQLRKELDDLTEQRDRVIGKHHYSNDRFYDKGSPFAKEVEARMTSANGEIAKFDLLKKESINKVWLADAPAGIAELLANLSKQVKPMIDAVHKKYKGLPEPKIDA